MAALQRAIAAGAVPNDLLNACPKGTKLHVLHVGSLECDEGFVMRGGETSLHSTAGQTVVRGRRKLPMYCVLIDLPEEGLILWETGAGHEYPELVGPVVADIFYRIEYTKEMQLKNAIAACGYDIKDVKKVIIGHLHLDHAGGLEDFVGTDTEIWVHDLELKAAYWSMATRADLGVYLPHYMDLKLNWKTFDEEVLDFCQGITLHHLPGHTDGLIGMQINLPDDGTFIFTSDHFHVIENYRDGIPQGWLARDHKAWFTSTQKVKRLEKRTKGRVIPGHDLETWRSLSLKVRVEVHTDVRLWAVRETLG